MKILVLRSVAMLITALLCACYYDNPLGDVEIRIENVSFSRDIVPIFSASCLGEGCHAGDHEPNLSPAEAYRSLRGENSSGQLYINKTLPDRSPIYREVLSGNMPPAGSLGKTQIEFIRAWIQKGAVND